MKNTQPKPNEADGVAVELSLFTVLRRLSKFTIFITIASIIIAFSSIAASVAIVYWGKDKDKIIERDASGKPMLLQIDRPDAVYPAEFDVFMKETVPLVLSWDFAEVRSPAKMQNHIDEIDRYMLADFMPSFSQSLRTVYLQSVANQRAVIKASVSKVERFRIKGNQAMAVVNVELRALKLGAEGQIGESTEHKTYLIKVQRGIRNLGNPYGLFIYHFAVFGSDADIAEFR